RAITSHQRSESTLDREVKPGAAALRPEPDHFVDVDRRAEAFDRHRPQPAQFEIALAELARVFTNRNRTHRRERLQPRTYIGRMADQPVLHLPAGLDRIRHHFAGVDTDTGFERTQSFLGATLPIRT